MKQYVMVKNKSSFKIFLHLKIIFQDIKKHKQKKSTWKVFQYIRSRQK